MGMSCSRGWNQWTLQGSAWSIQSISCSQKSPQAAPRTGTTSSSEMHRFKPIVVYECMAECVVGSGGLQDVMRQKVWIDGSSSPSCPVDSWDIVLACWLCGIIYHVRRNSFLEGTSRQAGSAAKKSLCTIIWEEPSSASSVLNLFFTLLHVDIPLSPQSACVTVKDTPTQHLVFK